MESSSPTTGFNPKKSHQLRALLRRQFTLQRRQKKTIACQIIFPLLAILALVGLNALVNSALKSIGDLGTIFPQPVNLVPTIQSSVDFNNAVVFSVDDSINNNLSDVIGYLEKDGNTTGLLSHVPHVCSHGPRMSSATCSPYFIPKASPAAIDDYLYENLQKEQRESARGGHTTNRTFDAVLGAINFNDMSSSQQQQPPRLTYTVQYYNLTGAATQPHMCANSVTNCAVETRTALMNLVNTAFARFVLGEDDSFNISTSTQGMPYNLNLFLRIDLISAFGLLLFPFILLFPLPMLMYTVVLEKQGRMREMMKLMGMKMRNYWLTMYIVNYLVASAVVFAFCFISLVLGFGFIWKTNTLLLLLMFVGWCHAITSWSFFLSSLTNRIILAMILGYLIAIFGPIVGQFLETLIFVRLGTAFSFITLILMPFPMTHLFQAILEPCAMSQCVSGFSWMTDSKFVSGLFMLYFDAVFYLVLSLYLDAVLPQPWGIRKPALFFVHDIKNYIRGRKGGASSRSGGAQSGHDTGGHELSAFEDAHDDDQHALLDLTREQHSPRGDTLIDVDDALRNHNNDSHLHHHAIHNIDDDLDEDVLAEKQRIQTGHVPPNTLVLIEGLTKDYGKKRALDNLYLSIQQGQCFGLLGPNGAGKTTSISMLCGLYPPTSGTAKVCGYDIRTEIDNVHLSMGLCPQHDILWEDLTCEEHLLFYSRLKGIDPKEEKIHVKEILTSVGLSELTGNSFVHALSGGMRRRLSIAISLVGNPKVVLLDEPTTGLDPTSRRHVWDIISAAKANKCMILSTHSLEEADVLCDTIGIMSRGRLRCLGNSLHLKNKFGEGFRLSISFDDQPANFDRVAGFIQQLIPGGNSDSGSGSGSASGSARGAKLVTSFAGTAVFEVPKRGIVVSQLFNSIEAGREQYGIKDWAFSQTSLEDVFLRIAQEDEEDEAAGRK